jgi:hypothetical protein
MKRLLATPVIKNAEIEQLESGLAIKKEIKAAAPA